MSLPGICGLETEYGVWISDPHGLGQEEAAVALLDRCPLEPRIPWDLGAESPGNDARGPRRPRSGGLAAAGASAAAGCHPGYLLGNGARFYADHGHPEYATPECADALALVAADQAGERLLERCRRHLESFLPSSQSLRLFKNNSDRQGHSYGCHENYLMSAATYQGLFSDRIARLHATLVPFLVSRVVVGGAGKVGSENGRPAVDFQISQRADFFETVVGLQTMSRRPIVNTRDEAHADAARYRRLHVISGDANMAQLSTYLKVGTLQLLLAMLEDEAALPDLTLEDPVAAIGELSRDPTCRARVRLRDGRRLSGVELQHAIALAAQRWLDSSARPGEPWRPLFERWTAVIDQLAADPLALAGALDWVIKWKFLEEWRQRKGLAWSAAELKELDLRYHDTDPTKSVFRLLASAHGIEELVAEPAVARAESEPPPATRAALRAERLGQHGGEVIAASWSAIVRAGGSRELLPDCFDSSGPVVAGEAPLP
jgi:proteasome accessory factor PafA2